jgi:hypothetical protein
MAGAALGLALGLIARVWLATLRVTSSVHPGLDPHSPQPWVLSFWHGQLFPLLAFRRRRRTVAMVSLSTDGNLLSWAFKLLGVGVCRGSSSRGGREALEAIVGMMRVGWDGAFAVDGPRGPRRVPHTGALRAAAECDGQVVPFAAACSRSLVLRASWDQFELPLPFSRVAVVLDAPVHAADRDGLAVALERACERARAALQRGTVSLAAAEEHS